MSGGVSCDPYTGSGAYTSGSGGVITGTQGGPAPEDPWMAGAYRYIVPGTKLWEIRV